MGLPQLKKFLHIEINSYQNQKTTYRMGENLSYSTDKGLISRTYKELKKLNIKRTNSPINKWVNKLDSSQKKKFKWLINT
jgi:hypothetical protein